MLADTPGASCSNRRARLRINFSAFSASPNSQAWRSTRRTVACWLRQPLHDVASLVNLTPLNQRLTPEAAPDRFRERLRSVDDEQPRHRRIEPARDKIVDERLHHGGVLGCAFNEPERMLHAFAVDADRRHQHKLASHVDAVDLHHQEVQLG